MSRLLTILLMSTAVSCIFADRRTTEKDGDMKNYYSKRRGGSRLRKLIPAEERSVSEGFGGARIGRVTLHRTVHHISVLREWNDFKQRHNKMYPDGREEQRRLGIFIQNKARIEEHNRQGHTFNVSMNEYGDMTHEEFVRTLNGFKRNYGDSLAKPHASNFLAPHHVRLPTNIDWRTHGYVTPVKNQGHCGSCWSFSATGALEGQHKRKNGTLVSLSEQNLIDCSGPFGNHGCNGGLMDQAFQYIKANDGIDTELSYPYEAQDDRCRYRKAKVGAEDTGFVDIPKGDEHMLEMAVGTVGPVSVAIDASHSSFQFYDSGIYFEPKCSSEQLDHGVLVVGYGVNDDNVEYWLVKNSWGTTWGEQGFIKMARNRDNMCGIASSASYPLV